MNVFGVPALSLALVGCSAIFVALGVHAYRQCDTVGRRWFLTLMATEMAWTGAYGVQLAVSDPGTHYALQGVTLTLAVAVPVVALFFFLEFAGEGGFVRPATVLAGLLVPALVVVSFLTNPATGLAYREYRLVQAGAVTTSLGEAGPGLLLARALTLGIVGLSAAVLGWTIYRYRSLYRKHVPWLVGLFAVTLGAFFAYRAGYSPVPGLRLLPFTAPLQGIIYGNLLFRYEFMGVSSRARRIGRRAAMQSLDDGVLVIDDDRRILDCNPIAESVLDLPATPVGTPAADVLGAERTAAIVDGGTRELLAADGARRLEATATPMTDQHDAVVGYVVLLRDVTERKRREQRLSVLNRVLRHNVRNETTALKGRAELIADEFDGRAAELAAEIESAADDLVALGEKARRLEAVLGEDRRPETVDGPALARRVVDDVAAEFPDVSFTVEGEGASLVTRPDVLEPVLRAAVENAAEHNDAADPAVVVAVAPAGDGVTITVRDNGPGIPSGELAALESGEETPLDHASGLGVWLIRWGIEYLDGDVAFDRDGGTVVTLSVPDARRDGATAEPGVEAA